ncbi:amino acid ABC transporter permease [Phyllobacterium sp. SB3]|uniref:amino acid ABC transporter permease n=1 Tax=Phyllobacterium sp. SB3 TaxID=3156073 RepID=UPI0032AF0FFE
MAYQMQFRSVLQRMPELMDGVILTIQLGSTAIALGLTVGVVGAAGRSYGPRWLDRCIGGYVEVIRNTPLLVQLFLVFFGLPLLGFRVSANTAALVGLVVNLGAYSTEIFRSGFQAIVPAQIQAGIALAMSPWQIFRHVIFFPALKIVYPALVGQVTLTFLSTSIVSAISAAELTSVANTIESQTFRSLETYIIVTIIYVVMTLLFRFLCWLLAQVLFGSVRDYRISRRLTPVATEVAP